MQIRWQGRQLALRLVFLLGELNTSKGETHEACSLEDTTRARAGYLVLIHALCQRKAPRINDGHGRTLRDMVGIAIQALCTVFYVGLRIAQVNLDIY
jgi:hypothetical protein